jgi:hypothetical protein
MENPVPFEKDINPLCPKCAEKTERIRTKFPEDITPLFVRCVVFLVTLGFWTFNKYRCQKNHGHIRSFKFWKLRKSHFWG